MFPTATSSSRFDVESIAAHELRGPAAALVHALDVVLEAIDTGDVADARRFAQGCRDAAHMMERRATTLLAQHATRQPSQTCTDLSLVVRGRHAALNPWAAVQGIDIRLAASNDELFVTLDDIALSQVVDNVVRNAVQHARRTVELHITSTLTDVVIDVTDDGDGCAADINPFAPWKSGHPEGVGIGLPLTRELLARVGGSISMSHNDETSCTIVQIRLPRITA